MFFGGLTTDTTPHIRHCTRRNDSPRLGAIRSGDSAQLTVLSEAQIGQVWRPNGGRAGDTLSIRLTYQRALARAPHTGSRRPRWYTRRGTSCPERELLARRGTPAVPRSTEQLRGEPRDRLAARRTLPRPRSSHAARPCRSKPRVHHKPSPRE